MIWNRSSKTKDVKNALKILKTKNYKKFYHKKSQKN